MADNILRQSQLITTYGPGAMLDLPDHSVIVSGLSDWSLRRSDRVEEPRLVAKAALALGLSSVELRAPPRHEADLGSPAPVGARIFPTWFIVQEARPSPRNPGWRRRRLVRWQHLDKGRFRDEDGGPKPVVPVRFVCGCRKGHIDDLDWRLFVHEGRRGCERPLWLEERGVGADIGDTFGVCDCGAERSLYEASSPGSGALGHCEGKRPWIGQYARETCGEPYRLLVRTASNAYFPQTMSVISLPEAGGVLAAAVTAHHDRLMAIDALGMLAAFRNIPEVVADFANFTDEAVIAEFRRQSRGDQDLPVKAAEFEVLNGGDARIGEDDPRAKFHAETLARAEWDPDDDPLLAGIDKLVLAHRLREVVALLGFTRFEAVNPDKDGEFDLDVTRADLAETISWLPAVENRGEGVFVSFNPEAIEEWSARPGVRDRAARIEAGWKVWARERQRPEEDFPGLPYVMLHSLSHMLMRSIALDCGYPASSLRERVYAGGGYGLLIYTGSPDSEGTLGGLVEAGRRFARHLRRALSEALLCSNDPVCSEHDPESPLEGRPLLGAACHGCLLVAETSCEQRNDFLDRAVVIPSVADAGAAFFDPEHLDR